MSSAADKGKGKASAGGPPAHKRARTDASDEVLIQRLPRSALEALVLASLKGNNAITRAELEAQAAPEALVRVVQRAAPVGSSDALVSGDSPFAACDAELTLRILAYLDTRSKYVAAFEVCKGWRALRHDAALWRSVVLEATKKPPSWVSGAGAVRFLSASGPVRDCAAVKELELGGTGMGADHFKAAFKQRFPALERLTLSGKKLSALALQAMAKHAAAQLTHFTLGKRGANTGFEHVLDVLAAAPRLTHLTLALCLSHDGVVALAQRAREARDDGAPLLQSLVLFIHGNDTVDTAWDAGCLAARALTVLGGAAPELASLDVARLCALSHVSAVSGAFAPLPRLERVRIGGLQHTLGGLQDAFRGEDYAHTRASETAGLQATLARLVSAAPALRVLDLNGRGRSLQGGLSGAMPLGGGLAGVPAAATSPLLELRTLRLTNCIVAAADFAAVASLPVLRTVELSDAGEDSLGAAVAIASVTPQLRSLTCTCIPAHSSPPPLNGGAAIAPLAQLACASLQLLKLDFGSELMTLEQGADAATGSPDDVRPSQLAAALRAVAAAGGLPSLSHLSLAFSGPQVAYRGGSVAPTGAAAAALACFDDGAAWQWLRELRLERFPPNTLSPLLSGMAAPALRVLALPPHLDAEGRDKCALAAYTDARKRCPLLPLLAPQSRAAGVKGRISSFFESSGGEGAGPSNAQAE